MASLKVNNGPSAGREIEVEGDVIIGRETSDLTIEDPEISRRHAVVRLVTGAIEVEDLGSSNGTFVDGSRIDGPTRVAGGGQIRCGTTLFDVSAALPAQETQIRAVKPAPPVGSFRPPCAGAAAASPRARGSRSRCRSAL